LLACAPVAVTAGWMLADGARAILLGDYVTPSAWAHLRVATFAGLWYLPFGTVLNGVTLALLSRPALRQDEPPTTLGRGPRARGR
jgi:hypothetical protein